MACLLISASTESAEAQAIPSSLETAHELCREKTLHFVDRAGKKVSIPADPKGLRVPVAANEIVWYCGDTKERTGCPLPTDSLQVIWWRQSIEIKCLLETEISIQAILKEACGEAQLRVVGRDGEVAVAPGKSTLPVPTKGSEIVWYCGKSRERSVCPNQPLPNSHVSLHRSVGRDFNIVCGRIGVAILPKGGLPGQK